jgi:hypothetical protein
MNRMLFFGLIVVSGIPLHAQTVHVRGRVSDGAGQPIAEAVVELVRQGLKDTTGADGAYSLENTGVSIPSLPAALTESITFDNGILELTVGKPASLKVEVFDLNGNVRKRESLPKARPGVYHLDVASPFRSNGIRVVQASIGPLVRSFRYLPMEKEGSGGNSTLTGAPPAGGMLAKTAAVIDTLRVSASGHASEKIALSSYDTTLNVTLGGGVPHVTPQNATSIPAMYGNAVTNGGKLETNLTYSAYYWSTSISSPLPPPTVPKQATAKTKSCNVYTPPGYDPQTKYPLIIIMHGITDNPNTWVERSNPKIATLFDNLILSKSTKPFIAVFASGTIDNNTNAYYAFGAEMMNDLLPFIESKYSVRTDRGSRAMAGFSFGGMQTLSIGLCAHLKEFAWFAGLDAAGPGTPNADDIAKYVAAQNPQAYPLHYLYLSAGRNDGGAKGSLTAAANGLTSKGPYITTANFSSQTDIAGPGNGAHVYPTAEIGLYNLLRMAFAAD